MPKFEANKEDFAKIWQKLGAIAPPGCAVSWGLCSSYPSGFLVRGHFGGGDWRFGCASWGFGVVPERVGSDAWSWDSSNLGISC